MDSEILKFMTDSPWLTFFILFLAVILIDSIVANVCKAFASRNRCNCEQRKK